MKAHPRLQHVGQSGLLITQAMVYLWRCWTFLASRRIIKSSSSAGGVKKWKEVEISYLYYGYVAIHMWWAAVKLGGTYLTFLITATHWTPWQLVTIFYIFFFEKQTHTRKREKDSNTKTHYNSTQKSWLAIGYYGTIINYGAMLLLLLF